MFITPKTDWTREDYFDLYPDYFRIKNNILELLKLVQELYGSADIIPMEDYGIEDNRFSDFYNNVERNLDILADSGFRNPAMPATATWQDNRAAWDYNDLNRIEGSIQMMYRDLYSQYINRRKIAFVLGGTEFEQTI